MNFDLVFIDTVCPEPYDYLTLTTKALGGTEASVIRIAEGLGSLGLKVVVFQHNRDTAIMGNHAYYLPISNLKEAKAKSVIGIRSTRLVSDFRYSKKFVWHHDLPQESIIAERQELIDKEITVIAVSKWHKTALQEVLCDANNIFNPKVVYIYNPIIDSLFIEKDIEIPYNKNKLIWLSSPHKGLDKALFLFERLVDLVGRGPELHIYNPGYMGVNENAAEFKKPDVYYHGPLRCVDAWNKVSQALCLFYPTVWAETFGLCAAEANCLHTPVASFSYGALPEVCGFKNQLAPMNDNKVFLDKVTNWYNGSRPKVYGNANFKLSEVLVKWTQLILK